MKHKQTISILLVTVMVLGLLSGCAGNQPGSVDPTQDTPEPELSTAATLLSVEEDARLKEALQKDIDAILSTETEIVHSDIYIPGETYTGTAYYISNDGNDDNDGLTPESAWQTISKLAQEADRKSVV